MATLLPTITIRPTPRVRETLLSYLSPAAAMRGLALWEFTLELGLSQKALIALDPDAMDQVGAFFDLTPDELTELASWSPQPVAGVRMQFRNAQVVSRAVVNPTARGRPECLREDAGQSDRAPTDGMVMRGDWQVGLVLLDPEGDVVENHRCIETHTSGDFGIKAVAAHD
ncbi:TniQ family protein [uncultured Ruegeria sp.]|uniref:TniQ family protein n=1 Tax=uncultured Ruegeria sp. TaxID=259304 RepID=UPI00262830EE|nr:TniQ family protein [uncultured Ruegeria sp.]